MNTQRLAVLDGLRGLAILAMIAYHFSWDLSWFALVNWPVADGPFWRAAAATIAGSFLFISGISLSLAHGEAVRWRAFWRRFLIVAVCAAAISAGTYFAFGANFVRFGILHAIAASSLAGICFVRLPVWCALAAAALIASLPNLATHSAFDGPLWFWTGLGQPGHSSVDYVPLAPWAAVTLSGVAIGRVIARPAFHSMLAVWQLETPTGRGVRRLGRYSLPIYLVHQPLMFGALWSLSAIGLLTDPSSSRFISGCTQSCAAFTGERDACEMACACTLTTMQNNGKWEAIVDAPSDSGLQSDMNETYRICLGKAGLN